MAELIGQAQTDPVLAEALRTHWLGPRRAATAAVLLPGRRPWRAPRGHRRRDGHGPALRTRLLPPHDGPRGADAGAGRHAGARRSSTGSGPAEHAGTVVPSVSRAVRSGRPDPAEAGSRAHGHAPGANHLAHARRGAIRPGGRFPRRLRSRRPSCPSRVSTRAVRRPGSTSSSPDVDAAVAFYGGLFGWVAPELPPEAGGYRMFEKDGIPVAGCGPIMMEGQPSAWTTYVSVADADATMARVTGAGGVIFVPPMDVLEAGRMAVFADTTGAACAVWQPKEHPGAGLVNEARDTGVERTVEQGSGGGRELLLPRLRLGGEHDGHGRFGLHGVEARRCHGRRHDGTPGRDATRRSPTTG